MIFHNELLDETLHKKELDNGFKIYVLKKEGYTKKHAFFATEYGSLYNEFQTDDGYHHMPNGIAHFLEHKIFEDTNERIFDKFAKIGASVNAFTNHFATCYTFSTVDHVNEGIGELLDFVQCLELTEESVNEEKDIIIQELHMYEDQPQWRAFMNMLGGMYHYHPIKMDIGGSVESVQSITMEDLKLCYQSFYTPDRMFAFVIGDVDIEETMATIEGNLTEEFMTRGPAPRIVLPIEPHEVAKEQIEENVGLPMPIFYMGIKDRTFYKEPDKRLEKGLISKIISDLIFGKGSDFYEKYYAEGLVNASFSCDFSYGRTFGYTGISAETKEPEVLRTVIAEEIDKFKSNGLDEASFERIRKKMVGRHLSSFNSTQYIANSFVNYYMKGIELFDYLETLEKLQFKQVEDRFLEHYDLQYSTVSIIK